MARKVLIVGSGKRVQEAALPALRRLADRFTLAGIVSRSAKEIEVEGCRFAVSRLADLDAATLRAADLVYMVVAKPAVPSVLKTLTRHDVSGTST